MNTTTTTTTATDLKLGMNVAERCYLTRPSGETILYGVRTTEGRFISARDVAWLEGTVEVAAS